MNSSVQVQNRILLFLLFPRITLLMLWLYFFWNFLFWFPALIQNKKKIHISAHFLLWVCQLDKRIIDMFITLNICYGHGFSSSFTTKSYRNFNKHVVIIINAYRHVMYKQSYWWQLTTDNCFALIRRLINKSFFGRIKCICVNICKRCYFTAHSCGVCLICKQNS